MLKKAFLSILATWNSNCARHEHADLEIEIPLTPLLVACEFPGRWSVRDAYICRTAQRVQNRYTPHVGSQREYFDITPDICSGDDMGITLPNYAQSWGDTFDELWRRVNYGWNVSAPIQDAIFSNNEEWNEVSIEGDWMQVLRTLECLEGIGTAIPRIRTLSVLVQQPRGCIPSGHSNMAIPTLEDVNRTTTALFAITNRMSSLRTLRISVPNIPRDWFAKILSQNQTVQVPIVNETDRNMNYTISNSITSLSLGPFTHPLLYHTPHVRNITLHKWGSFGSPWDLPPAQDALVDAIVQSGVPVQHLEVYEISQPGKLARIAKAVPGLKSLDLRSTDVTRRDRILDFKDLLPELQAFTNATTLSLPPVYTLDSDYDPPWCGNAYINNPGLQEKLNRQYDVSVRRLVDLVKEHLPVVERVRFGAGGAWWDLR